jgi:glycosyltransferase involved in cell wall biosynthesis
MGKIDSHNNSNLDCCDQNDNLSDIDTKFTFDIQMNESFTRIVELEQKITELERYLAEKSTSLAGAEVELFAAKQKLLEAGSMQLGSEIIKRSPETIADYEHRLEWAEADRVERIKRISNYQHRLYHMEGEIQSLINEKESIKACLKIEQKRKVSEELNRVREEYDLAEDALISMAGELNSLKGPEVTRGLKLSIITPSLNSALYIEKAIRSVLCQGYGNVEHIIVDGGSTDGTVDILKRYPHLRWVSEPDNGQSQAMNKGFSMSTGDIIGYLNADDYYLPGAFHAIMPCFDQGAHFVVGKIMVVLDDGSYWVNDARTEHCDMLAHWEPEAFCVNPCGYLYKREVQEKAGGYNEKNTFSMDLEFLLEASKNYTFTKVDRLLGVFRYIQGTITSNSQKSESIWTPGTFNFVETYLESLPADFVHDFKRKRAKGYLQRKIWVFERECGELEDKLNDNNFSGKNNEYDELKSRQEYIKNRIDELRKEMAQYD